MIYEYHETVRQPYQNCAFSAGFVEGHPVDTLYLKLERDGEDPYILLLRPDEAAAIAWCLTGVLWSDHMARMGVTKNSVPTDCEGKKEQTAKSPSPRRKKDPLLRRGTPATGGHRELC